MEQTENSPRHTAIYIRESLKAPETKGLTAHVPFIIHSRAERHIARET